MYGVERDRQPHSEPQKPKEAIVWPSNFSGKGSQQEGAAFLLIGEVVIFIILPPWDAVQGGCCQGKGRWACGEGLFCHEHSQEGG